MGKRKSKKWKKQTLRLNKAHSWKAPAGYKIVVLDRGAVQFNVPEDWIVVDSQPFVMHDADPPDDEARLSVSFWRLPPGVDWTALPLDAMLMNGMNESKLDVLEQGPLQRAEREDLELVWSEHRFLDEAEQREAYSRMALARGWDVQTFLTLDFWVDDAPRLLAMWDELLRSLQLGQTIEDPTRGKMLH